MGTILPLARLPDALHRPLRDLRVSVTDRCNFRCRYCMPREVFGPDHPYLPRRALLRFEEIHRVVRVARGLGLRKVRLTGGEPLLRRDLPELIRMLKGLEGLEVALTTNGSLLRDRALELADAGLDRVTVSLDSLDPDVFRTVCDTPLHVDRVLEGIEAAADAGLTPVKVNAMIRRSVNQDAVLELARRFRGTGHVVRFIEFMDVGTCNGWRRRDVVTAAEIVRTVAGEFPAEPLGARYRGEVARRWRYLDGQGEFGVISSVTQPFCGDCTRARLSADGFLYTCLFATRGTDLRDTLRGGSSDARLRELVSRVWSGRRDRYSEARARGGVRRGPRIEMSYIGG